MNSFEETTLIEELLGSKVVTGNKKRSEDKKEVKEKFLHPVLIEDVW